MTHTHCPICKLTHLHLLRGFENHDLASCRDCGFVFMFKIPTISELTDHYRAYSYIGRPGSNTLISFRKLLDRFEGFRNTNNLLDYGCGKGWFLEEAKLRGWNVYGTEFSQDAVSICEQKGILMKKGELLESDFDFARFDVIFCSEVIEHVSDPLTHLQSMFKALRPGGCLFLTTPNFNSYLRYQYGSDFNIIEYPEHLCYFTRQTINMALRNVGFIKHSLQTTGVSISRSLESRNIRTPSSDSKLKDEKLRDAMNSNRFMQLLKDFANLILTVMGIGFTIKAMYLKPLTEP